MSKRNLLQPGRAAFWSPRAGRSGRSISCAAAPDTLRTGRSRRVYLRSRLPARARTWAIGRHVSGWPMVTTFDGGKAYLRSRCQHNFHYVPLILKQVTIRVQTRTRVTSEVQNALDEQARIMGKYFEVLWIRFVHCVAERHHTNCHVAARERCSPECVGEVPRWLLVSTRSICTIGSTIGRSVHWSASVFRVEKHKSQFASELLCGLRRSVSRSAKRRQTRREL